MTKSCVYALFECKFPYKNPKCQQNKEVNLVFALFVSKCNRIKGIILLVHAAKEQQHPPHHILS